MHRCFAVSSGIQQFAAGIGLGERTRPRVRRLTPRQPRPCAPPRVDPAWRQSTILGLARQIVVAQTSKSAGGTPSFGTQSLSQNDCAQANCGERVPLSAVCRSRRSMAGYGVPVRGDGRWADDRSRRGLVPEVAGERRQGAKTKK